MRGSQNLQATGSLTAPFSKPRSNFDWNALYAKAGSIGLNINIGGGQADETLPFPHCEMFKSL
jgi:hypothetical protein